MELKSFMLTAMASLPLAELQDRKARGAFFTPPEIAHFLTKWAIRGKRDKVLEPSCGEAAFLLSAGKRLCELGATDLSSQLHGLDIHEGSLAEARELMSAQGLDASLDAYDFFERDAIAEFDAVIGNPPFVRYQSFGGAFRVRAIEAALKQGVKLNQLASSWAAFTVHSSAFLKPGGRLALVLPAELLAVKYASQIRRFLLNRFAKVRLVLFEGLVFPGVLEEVVLLLADGSGGQATSFEVYQASNFSDLENISSASWQGFTPMGDSKWTGALLPSSAFQLYESLLTDHRFELMQDWGDTYLGGVTGNNSFFALNHTDVREWRLKASDVVRISPPGSRHLRGLNFTEVGWEAQRKADERCYLFAPEKQPSQAGFRYIAHGETLKVNDAYKCRVRSPWWRVPLVDVPHLFFVYMNHECPRLIRNGAGVQVLNSLYGVRLKAERRKAGQELLAVASLNSLTLLGGEIVGRSYGGGLLKFEPTEAAVLPLPSFSLLQAAASQLRLLMPQIGALLRRNDIMPVVEVIDRVVLKQQLQLSDDQMGAIRRARHTLFQRRLTRARGRVGTNQ
jgi:adenine-specific DNA-methyltransferase